MQASINSLPATSGMPAIMVNHIAFIRDGGHTCIAYEVTAKRVLAVAMDSPELTLINVGTERFYEDWRPIEGYSAQKAADRYLMGMIPIPSNIQYILEAIKMNQEVDAAKAKAVPAAPAAPEKAKGKATKPEAKPAKAPAAATAKSKTPAKPAKATAKATAKVAAAPAGKKSKITSDTTIKLLKSAEGKTFQEGSVRSQVFAKIKDGQSIKELVKACAKFADEKQVIACVGKLADVNQKLPTIALK